MTAHDIQSYRRRLRETASRLTGEVASLRAEALRPTGSETGGASDEQADPGTQAADGRLALTLLGTEAEALSEVNAALDRIERGTFGRCEACGRPVGRARLNVLPQARHCIACARRIEAGGAG
jgi:DnaK suppressor protein